MTIIFLFERVNVTMKKYAVQTTFYVTPKKVHQKLLSLAKESDVFDLEDKKFYIEFNSDDTKLETFKSKVKKCLLLNDQDLKPPTTVLIYDENECVDIIR